MSTSKTRYLPYLIIFISFFGLIIVGSILLRLPISLQKGVTISYLDSLFVSTSSVTLTGLITVNLSTTFNLFGEILTLVLCELSAITIITLIIFILQILGVKMGLSAKLVLKENISSNSFKDVENIMLEILICSLVIQGSGVILYFFVFMSHYDNFGDLLKVSIFQSISAFTNNGMWALENASSYSNNIPYILVTSYLIIFGRFGFPVVFDIIKNKRWKQLNTNTKICLKMMVILTLLGFTALFLNNLDLGIPNIFFLTVVARSGGMWTNAAKDLSLFSQIVIMLLMFIGGSPASTGGGMKTTALYTVYKSFSCYITKNKPMTNQKYISESYQLQSFSILTFCFIVCTLTILGLSISEPNADFLSIMFESVSAFSNNGMTIGLTAVSTTATKIILIITMFIGRLGVLTCLHLLKFKQTQKGRKH